MIFFCLLSCSHVASQEKINFEDHILPIFRNNCVTCHNPDKSKADYSLTTFEDAIKGGETGPAVISKNPDESLLYRLVARSEKPYMPRKEPKMDDQKIKLIRLWIQQGLLKTAGAKVIQQKKLKIQISDLKPTKGKPKVALKMPKMINLEPIFRTNHTGQLLAQASNPWSPLVAFSLGNQILLYDINKVLLRGILKFPEGMAYQLKFSRDGKFLLGSGGIAGQKGVYVLWRVEDGEIIRKGGQEFDSILSGDISSDLKYVCSGGSSKLVKIYDLSSGKIIHKLKKHNDWVLATEFSPDGVLLASADRNGGIVVWESRSGQQYCLLNGHKAAVNALSWRADSNLLVSGSEDGIIKVWSLHRRRQIKSWKGHGGGVLWVEYAKDGKIVSCGRDKLIKIWDKNGKQIKTIRHFKDLPLRASFSSDRRFIIAGDYRGEAVVFNAKSGKVRNRFKLSPPNVQVQKNINNKQVANIKIRLAKKRKDLAKIKKEVLTLKNLISRKKKELEQLKKKPAKSAMQKEIKGHDVKYATITKKKNDTSRQLKHLNHKNYELLRQVNYWESAILIKDLEAIQKQITNSKSQLDQLALDVKNHEVRWQFLKKRKQELLVFLKKGHKEHRLLKEVIKKNKKIQLKELKKISVLLKDRGQIKSEIYEAEFMKKELKISDSKTKKMADQIKSLASKFKSIEGKINHSKTVLLSTKKSNSQKIKHRDDLGLKLKKTPKELASIEKEIKNLNRRLSTPNPLSKTLPEKIKQNEIEYNALLNKFNLIFAKFEK